MGVFTEEMGIYAEEMLISAEEMGETVRKPIRIVNN